mgnify:CR=1 FL=1
MEGAKNYLNDEKFQIFSSPKFGVNKYLELTGDYNSIKLLRFYLVYRAMTRAKVTLLTDKTLEHSFLNYLKLADSTSKGMMINKKSPLNTVTRAQLPRNKLTSVMAFGICFFIILIVL